MLAAVVCAIGQPPKFQDFADPVAGEGEVVVTEVARGTGGWRDGPGQRGYRSCRTACSAGGALSWR